jgi:hypothetical protein
MLTHPKRSISFELGPSRFGEKEMPHQCQLYLYTLDLDSTVNPLGPKFCSQPIGLLKFDVPWFLDPSMNAPSSPSFPWLSNSFPFVGSHDDHDTKPSHNEIVKKTSGAHNSGIFSCILY